MNKYFLLLSAVLINGIFAAAPKKHISPQNGPIQIVESPEYALNNDVIKQMQGRPDILASHRDTLIKLFQVADTQSKIMKKLMDTKEVNLDLLRLTEIDTAIAGLEREYKILDRCDANDAHYDDIQKTYIPILLELDRKLKVLKQEYQQRTKKETPHTKRLMIPLGVSVATFASLLALDYLTSVELDLMTMLKWSVMAGVVTGIVVYKNELIGVIRKGGRLCMLVGSKAVEAMGSRNKLLKVGGGVAALVAAGAVVYTQKDTILGLLGFKKKRDISTYYKKG